AVHVDDVAHGLEREETHADGKGDRERPFRRVEAERRKHGTRRVEPEVCVFEERENTEVQNDGGREPESSLGSIFGPANRVPEEPVRGRGEKDQREKAVVPLRVERVARKEEEDDANFPEAREHPAHNEDDTEELCVPEGIEEHGKVA